jgi:hypothetical protein
VSAMKQANGEAFSIWQPAGHMRRCTIQEAVGRFRLSDQAR